jgi:hypothetical protein
MTIPSASITQILIEEDNRLLLSQLHNIVAHG